MKIFVNRPVATSMLFLALLFLGIYSFLHVPIELAPKEEYPRVNIVTSWPGVPPEIIQTEITSPFEEQASTVKGVRKITSSSQIGRSKITLEFDPQTNMEFAHLALKEKIAQIKRELPERTRPQIIPFVPEEFQVEAFLEYTISGDYPIQKMREMLKEKLEMGLGAIKGISEVRLTGGSEPEIRIVLNKDKLKSLNIHPHMVSYRVNENLRTYPAGKIEKGNQEYIFKVKESITSLRDLREIIVSRSGENVVQLKDIADIVPSYKEIRYLNRINGKPTIRLTIQKESGRSTLKLSRQVKKELEQIKEELPSDLIFRIVNDESQEIHKQLRELYLLVGIIVSVIFILVFVALKQVKPSLLVLSSILFSVFITFNFIYFFNISINMLTLGGLALGFGLFVDNSIVVFENVLRKREKGLSPLKSAVKGSKEVFLPVLAATLTTMSVFFSFAYFQGRLKIYYLPLAVVIASALAASLLVSFSLIPALSPKVLKKRKKEKNGGYERVYERILKFILRHPIELILILVALFLGSYKWFRSEVTIGEWFHWSTRQYLTVRVSMPPGTDIQWTDRVAKKFEKRVMKKDYEKEMNTTVTSENAYLRINFPPNIEYSYRPYVLKEELVQLATNFAGVGIGIYGFDPQSYHSSLGTHTYYGSRIKFYGYNLKKLKEITSSLERTLKRNPRIKEVRIISSRYRWGRLDYFEYVLKIQKESLKKYSIDPQYLYSHIGSFIQGRVSSSMEVKIDEKEMDLSIKFPQSSQLQLKNLQNVLINTQKGEHFRLGEISKVEEKPIAGSIDREDQQFQQTVMWEFRGPSKAADRYKKDIFSKLDLPPGFSATLEERYGWMTEEEKGQITFAIIFSLIIIFMILSSLYESFIQPFFILLAVPLALVGVFVAFVLADFPFDSSAYIGVILLGGIVVNNSILLVDHINLKRR
ncbi:efflux RND transporter permease subunit, partial [bacterium]|nr:efflux RND transporter permease subunit [bacterium]